MANVNTRLVMAKVLVLGATGSLGRYVAQQAISANHVVSTIVRTPSKLPTDIRWKSMVYEMDIAKASTSALANIFRTNDVVIDTAGFVADKQTFTALTDHIVSGLESLPEGKRPVCWFMAGAAILDLNDRGRRGVDLPLVKTTYWPHRVNFDRIRRTTLDWRILCPGPMVEEPHLSLDQMRISLDLLPVQMPAFSKFLPKVMTLPFFTYRIPEMIVSYADAAAVMLANIAPDDAMSRHRVGLALPVGMRGRKKQWSMASLTLLSK
jgi:putative NADH-flavin reductase